MSNPREKQSGQGSILRKLARKKALSVDELKTSQSSQKSVYALTRSIKGMIEKGLVEIIPTAQSEFIRITQLGRERLYSSELSSTEIPMTKHWDGKWRMVILDLPEGRKNEREALRYLLKKAGFMCAKNSVWISPFPFEHFFSNIKKDLGLTNELMIIITDSVDDATELEFWKYFKK